MDVWVDAVCMATHFPGFVCLFSNSINIAGIFTLCESPGYSLRPVHRARTALEWPPPWLNLIDQPFNEIPDGDFPSFAWIKSRPVTSE